MIIDRQNIIPDIPETSTTVSRVKMTPTTSAITDIESRFVYILATIPLSKKYQTQLRPACPLSLVIWLDKIPFIIL
jgi:hypothetical protein